MRLKYSFVCDAANISQAGTLNVMGIFTNISAHEFPVTHSRMTYVASMEFHRSEEGTHRFKVSFIDEDGKSIVPTLEGSMHVGPSNLHSNMLLDLNSVVFPRPGTYAIDLIMDNQHVVSETLTLTQIPE